MNFKFGISLALAFSIAQASAAQHGQSHNADSFSLVSESTSRDVSLTRTSAILLRTYRLYTGDYVELIHTVEADGTLELDASRQSEDALSKLDRYCARYGGQAARTGVSILTKETQTLLSCSGSGPRPKATGSSSNPSASASRAFCDATMSIVMDGPGSVNRGDPGGFAVHADAEWEGISGSIVTWHANFLPGCSLGESGHHQRWLWASRAVTCGTGSLSLGMHDGSATIEACNSRDYSFITTEIWR